MILITPALRDARPADSLMTAVNLRSCCNGSECVWGHAPVIEDCGVCWTAQVSFWESLALPQTDVCAGEQWRKRRAVWCVIPLKNEKCLTADAQQLSQTVVLQLSHKIIIYYYNSPQHFFPSIACVSHLQTFNPFLILTQSPFIHLDGFPHHRGHFVYLFNVCLHLLHKHNKQQHTIILCIRTVKTIYSFLLCVCVCVFRTDVSVLLSQLGDYSRIFSLAGHQKAKHLLSVFAHDQLQRRLMLLQWRAQLCGEKETFKTDLRYLSTNITNPTKHTCVFLLQFPYLTVLLLDAHDQCGAWPVSRHLVQHLNLFLILQTHGLVLREYMLMLMTGYRSY